jgi:hypothetical protein
MALPERVRREVAARWRVHQLLAPPHAYDLTAALSGEAPTILSGLQFFERLSGAARKY